MDDPPEIRWRGFKVGCSSVLPDLVELIVNRFYLLVEGGWLISKVPNVGGFFGINGLDDKVLIGSGSDQKDQ